MGSAPSDVSDWQPHIVLTRGAAMIVLPDQIEKKAEDEKKVKKGAEEKTKKKDVVEEVEKDEERVEMSASPYAGPLLIGAEEYEGEVSKVTADGVDEAAARADANPSAARVKAGTYRKGHFSHRGVGFTIENAAGSKRRGIGADGTPWETTMPVPYGYAKRSLGADGDQVDVYFGPNPDSDEVWIIDQVDAETGDFDEHKTFVFFDSWADAQTAYLAAFSDGNAHARIGHVSSMSFDEYKEWLSTPQTEPRTMHGKTVTTGTGLVAYDLRGARKPKRGKAGKPRFEKVVQWRGF